MEIPRHEGTDPKICTDWIQVDVPTEVLRLLQERNRAHFGQAFGTPFTVPPLSTELGFDGVTATGQEILEGKYDTSPHSESVRLLLQHLQHVDEIHQHEGRPTITKDEFIGKLKVWSESTTTSPSGMHLGHYKSLLAKHSYSSDLFDDELTPELQEQRDELNSKQQDLFDLHLTMLNYALARGYSYQRWRTIANTILFKDKDNVRLDRTRVIHIYEADFNLALGIKWRNVMHKAEDSKAINDGQHGSRAKRCAPDPVFIEEIQYEIARATRKPLIMTSYDAKACYDRIIVNLAMLISLKHGLPFEVAKSYASTLEFAEYLVRTELGLSETGYRHEEAFPIYGTGQGSANSPAIWCLLSSTLFDCYDSVSRPAVYPMPNGEPPVIVSMTGFVDDCNSQTNLFHEDGSSATVKKLVDNSQLNVQGWNDLLSASGGALEPTKSLFQIMQFQSSMQGAPVLIGSHKEYLNAIVVQDRYGPELTTLKLLSAYTAHKTLGHFKEPAGTQAEQYKQLKKKSDETTAFLWKCPLDRLEAWTYYYAYYLPSVCYPLSCSFLTKRQLDTVQRKAMSIIVARCGFNRNTKKEVLYGPLELGGANFRHLYVEQGAGQVRMFMRHWRLRSTAGKLLRVAVHWFQQQTGVSFSILQDVKTSLPHLESKWIASLRDFLATADMSFQIDDPTIPPKQRLRDTYLMDVIIDSKKFTKAEIRRLNYCRLYLSVITVSDVSMPSGKSLDMSMLRGTPSEMSSKPRGPIIHQERPAEREWALWRKANLLWSEKTGKLHEPLGPWTLPVSEQRMTHPAYWQYDHLCGADTILFIRVNEEYIRCTQDTHEYEYQETQIAQQWEDLPADVCPVHARLISPGKWKVSYSTATIELPIGGPNSTFLDYVAMLPDWEEDLLKHTELPTDPYTVCEALSHGIRAVSDGSVWDNNQGAFGWMISTDTGDRTAKGMGPARGANVDSYRAEAYGMLSILTFLHRLAEYTTHVEPWSGILATDSQSLLDTIAEKLSGEDVEPPVYGKVKDIEQLDVRCAEWDILTCIMYFLKQWPELKLEYVRGHQDRKTAYDRLSLLAQLNVDADEMATIYQCDHGTSQPLVLMTPLAGVHLVSPNGTHTSKYDAAIRHQATYPGLLKYIQTRNEWTDHATNNINWKAHGSILRKRIKDRTHFVKLVHGVVPTCRQVHRHDPIRSLCPLCRQTQEDWTHVLQCTHTQRDQLRKTLVEKMNTKCKTLGTRPLLQRVLVDALTKWMAQDTPDMALDPAEYPPDVNRLIRRQNAIGWKHLWLGRFSVEWSDMQDNFYTRNPTSDDAKKKKKLTGQRWQVAIIGEIWDQWRVIWDSRNQDLHGADERQRAEVETREVRRDIRDLYDLRARLDPHLQALFHPDIATQYERPNWFNRNWLAIHAPTMRENLKQVTVRAKAGVRSIRDFLVPLFT